MSMRLAPWLGVLFIGAAMAGFLPLFVGCEDAPPTLSDLDRYFAEHPYLSDPRSEARQLLTIEPETASIVKVGDVVAFRAWGGDPPFNWAVSTPAHGIIRPSAVSSDAAVYAARVVGPNFVVVSDRAGRSAIATIVAVAAGALRITPEHVRLSRPAAGTVIQFVASGGSPPYGPWQVSHPALGTVDATGRYTVADPLAEGTNTVSVADAAGAFATARVIHDLGLTPLQIIPSTASLSTNGETAWFLAVGGRAPYQWSITYPGRGEIVSVSSDTTLMTYRRTSSGNNTVVLRDTVGAFDSITLEQPAPTPPVITPATQTLATNQVSCVFSVHGGTPPYVWSVVTGHGTVAPAVGNQTVYTRSSADPPGNYVIRVTDSSGLMSMATVIQQ